MYRPPKHANALKHGVFTKTMILPWEDPREFEKLYNALVDEWKPIGPTEHDAVLTIAKGMWRKRRIQYFVHCERMKATADPKHGAYDEVATLHNVSKIIAEVSAFPSAKHVESEKFDRLFTTLPDGIAQHLRQRLPRENFQCVSEWAHAIQKEIESVLLPASERLEEPGLLIFRDAEFFTVESIKAELAVEERIDAMIDRAVKRLVQAKAMKQMLGTANSEGDQPAKLLSNRVDESAQIITKNQNGRRSDGTRKPGAIRTNRKNSKAGGAL